MSAPATNAPSNAPSAEILQLLSQLRDIRTPPPIDWWPPAIGWWIVLVLACLLIIAALYFGRKQLQVIRWNKLVDAQIREIESLDSPAQAATATNRLLKRLIKQRYPQEQVNALSGQEWVEYLYDKYGAKAQTLDFSPLAESSYAPSVAFDRSALLLNVKKWVRKCC